MREFAFNLLLSVLKRHSKVTGAEMRPFCARVVSALEEKNVEVCLLAAKVAIQYR